MASTSLGDTDGVPDDRTNGVPLSLLLHFFHDATGKLNDHPSRSLSSKHSEVVGTPQVPPSLSHQRLRLLEVQRCALEDAVSDYNTGQCTDDRLNVEDAQIALRKLGTSGGTASVEGDELWQAMSLMNEAARLAFSRSVLRSELDWEKEEGQKAQGRDLRRNGDGFLDRTAILEFCGLCNAAVRLPEVERHLRDGTDLFGDCDDDASDQPTPDQSSKPSLVQPRLERIQKAFLRSVGYDPSYGMEEIKRIFFSTSEGTNEYTDDAEVQDIFTKFISAMTVALTNATLRSVRSDGEGRLSDTDEPGGVTRVVSVTYSEKFIETGADGSAVKEHVQSAGAPFHSTMEQQVESVQREQLAAAKEAAALQQNILGELLSMGEEKREEALKKAREAHDAFLTKALELPAGPERVKFLTEVDPDVQRLLVMHKLWDRYQAEKPTT